MAMIIDDLMVQIRAIKNKVWGKDDRLLQGASDSEEYRYWEQVLRDFAFSLVRDTRINEECRISERSLKAFALRHADVGKRFGMILDSQAEVLVRWGSFQYMELPQGGEVVVVFTDDVTVDLNTLVDFQQLCGSGVCRIQGHSSSGYGRCSVTIDASRLKFEEEGWNLGKLFRPPRK